MSTYGDGQLARGIALYGVLTHESASSGITYPACEFHALGVLWGAPEGPDESLRTDETVQFWEHDLPLQMAELAAQLEPGHRFDSIVVDEAQDFADAWWDPLLAALKDDETGGLYVFTDEGQRVFNRSGSPPVPLVPLILDHNVRNTRQIANSWCVVTPPSSGKWAVAT